MAGAIIPPHVPEGQIKSFGAVGEPYQVGRVLRGPLADGDWMVEVTLIKTGEKAEIRLTQIIDDPEAA